MKQKSSNLPSSIKLGVKTAGAIWGFWYFGPEFIWIVLGWGLICSVVRGLISFLFRLAILVGIISFLINHL